MIAQSLNLILAVGVTSSTVKVRPNFNGALAPAAQIEAARNEYEAFQVVVQGGASGIPDVRATAQLGGLPLHLYQVGLYYVQWASNIEGASGEWPDPLIPDVDAYDNQQRNAFPFAVAANTSRAIWVDVYVPPDTPPGMYTGSVTITGTGLATTTIPINLRVRAFTLPATASLKSSFEFGVDEACRAFDGTQYCNDNTQAEPWLRKFVKAALDHRISLMNPYYTMPSNNDWTYFDALDGPWLDGPLTTIENDRRDATFMMQEKAHFDARGWTGKLFDYTCDEPPQTCAWSDIPVRAQLVHTAGLRTLVTTSIDRAQTNLGAGWMDILDIAVPIVNEMDDAASGNQRGRYDAFLAHGAGKELWWYQSCESHGCGGCDAGMANDSAHGFPSYVIDASAIQNRAMEWLSYEYHLGGELYYAIAQNLSKAWDSYSNPTGAFCGFGGNGDGSFFYPGTPAHIGGTSGIPVETQRLKMIREGMEDYEYLHLLEQLGDGATAMQEAHALFPTLYQVTGATPEALYAARSRIADRIEQLMGAPPPMRPRIQAVRASGPVDIGGDLHEFDVAPVVEVGAGAAHATFRLLWDDTNLYLAAHVTDADIRYGASGHDGELWNADGIELLLDPQRDHTPAPDGDDRHLIITAHGDVRDAIGAGNGENASFDIAGLAVRATINGTFNDNRPDTDYHIAAAIPWTAIPLRSGDSVAAGLVLGADLALNDLDASGLAYADWAALASFAQPAHWNEIELVTSLGGSGGAGGNSGTGATMDSGCSSAPGAANECFMILCLFAATAWGYRPRRLRAQTPRRLA
jgi:hypothetical protein